MISKFLSSFVAFAVAAESVFLPVAALLPRAAFAADSITISRTPATSAASPYRAGDATTLSSTNPAWLFTSDYTGTGYNQIGSNAPRTFTFSTLQLRDSGACNASTGQCNIPGNWDASSFVCPAGVSGVQQMKEWYTVAGLASNTLTWYFECSATTPSSSQPLIGYFDGIDGNGAAYGWALDPDSSATSISVHFYIDGAAGGGGTFAGSAVADISRPDVNNVTGYPGNHGFNFSIPAQWRDGRAHTLYVHGIDLSGIGSQNVLLGGVPKSFTLGTSVQPGTIQSRSAKDGQPWDSPPYAANLTFPDGHSENITVDNPLDSPGSLAGTYSVNSVTPPAGVIFQNVNGNSLPYSQTLAPGGTISFTANFTAAPASSQPVLSLNPTSFQAGIALTTSLVNAAPNATIKGFCRDPRGQVCDDPALYSANSSGQFSHTYDTTGWTAGTYQVWATANGVQSNTASFIVTAPPAVNNPVLSLNTTSVAQGGSFTGTVTGAAPNAVIRLFGKGPDGVTAEDASGVTDASGGFSRTYATTGWAPGTYQGWVMVNGVQSNIVSYAITAQATISISRTPDTASFNPYRVGGATTFTSNTSPSLFSADYPITGYNQIGSYSPYVSSQTSTFAMRNSGFCNVSTGVCVIPGNWSLSQLACPAGVSGVQQMSEWYTVNGSISNKINWWFECAGGVPVNNPSLALSSASIARGDSFSGAVTNAAPGTVIRIFVQQPDGSVGEDASGVTEPSGNFSRTYSTAGWNAGAYHAWVTVNGVQSNVAQFTITAPDSGEGSITPLPIPSNALVNGNRIVLYQFKMTAPSSGDVRPHSFEFRISRFGSVTVGPLSLEGYSDSSLSTLAYYPSPFVTAPSPLSSLAGSGSDFGTAIMRDFSTSIMIPAGQSRYFVLSAPISNIGSGATLSVSFGGLQTQTLVAGGGAVPAITVLSPNGGEQWAIGSTQKITWSTSNVSLNQNILIGVRGYGSFTVLGEDGQYHIVSEQDIPLFDAPNGGSASYVVNLNPGTYKLFAKANVSGTIINDSSDAPFSITTATTTGNNPVQSLSATSIAQGGSFTGTITGAAPNAAIRLFGKGPDGVTAEDASGVTDASGGFSRTYTTAGWALGAYQSWASVNGAQSNVANFTITTSTSTPPVTGRIAPTPTTAPMATLTMEREQEQVLPDQPVSFKGTIDSTLVAFPQGSSIFIAIPEKVNLERIEMDGAVLSPEGFSSLNQSIKIPFPQNLYGGTHQFRIVLRNAVSSVPQLDRRISIWVSVVDAESKLLLKGRTASTLVAHLPTEVIGKGVSLSVTRTIPGWLSSGNCCWTSVGFPLLESGGSAVPGSISVMYGLHHTDDSTRTYFPIREFSFGEMDITRGPFWTPNSVPLLPENIAFTLFPNDAAMHKTALSLNQFSEPLAKEFITAQYQYILGRDPSDAEVSRYLPRFMQWRNPLAALAEVYNRRADVRQAVMVPRDMHIGGGNDGSPRPSWDKLLEWARTFGWKEEPSLASFKPQTGFDDGWQLFKELWEKYLIALGSNDNSGASAEANSNKNPVAAIAYLCYSSNMNHKNSPQNKFAEDDPINFEFCWKNDPMVRNYAILWAKDQGWAYNQFVLNPNATYTCGDGWCDFPGLATINPDGPILAATFGPGKYPEYAEEQQWRYPAAQLYYDLIASPEYASSIQQRFRANIDSIIRLFFGRPASEDDIAWAKDKFISGGYKNTLNYNRWSSWITPQWEPNGILIASNLEYMEEIEFVKNPRYITDDVYGIRHIQGEADAVSSRLVEMIEKYGRQELYQGDNFKRIVSGLYRLYMRRTPTDAEVEGWRASGKNFGDIEFSLNQSAEYGKNPASSDAIRNIYRNYLGRDPNDADVAQWGDKTISSISQSIGTSAEMKSLAQQHPENAYIFPIKRIKIKRCGFFCSLFKLRLTSLTSLIPGVGFYINMAINLGYAISGAVNPAVAGNVMSIVLNSISRGFNEAGFNGETFVERVSVARSMAGQAGGVFSMTNVFENADPTIFEGFRTMARAPQAPESGALAKTKFPAPHLGFASLIDGISGYLGIKQERSAPRMQLAQIDITSHYGGSAAAGAAGQQKNIKTGQAQAKNTIARNFGRGSSGADVLILQKFLGETDLTFLPEYRTGYYGAKTEAAVKRFQKRNGLEQVGSVGPKTRALLNSIIK